MDIPPLTELVFAYSGIRVRCVAGSKPKNSILNLPVLRGRLGRINCAYFWITACTSGNALQVAGGRLIIEVSG
ncbi:MAG: hypothetical protein KF752_09280 [Pirellulaceae bacterium]|nr:hypothetical protein [Pirellulaceae bacterium]